MENIDFKDLTNWKNEKIKEPVNIKPFEVNKKSKTTIYEYSVEIPYQIVDLFRNLFLKYYNSGELDTILTQKFKKECDKEYSEEREEIEIITNGYFDVFENGKNNSAIAIQKINKVINENDITNIQKALLETLNILKKRIYNNFVEEAIEVEQYKCKKFCLKCKFFIMCNAEKWFLENKKCKFLFDDKDNKFLENNGNEIKTKCLKKIEDCIQEFIQIEKIRMYFKIKTSDNKYLKNVSKETIKYIFSNNDYNKTLFLKQSWESDKNNFEF